MNQFRDNIRSCLRMLIMMHLLLNICCGGNHSALPYDSLSRIVQYIPGSEIPKIQLTNQMYRQLVVDTYQSQRESIKNIFDSNLTNENAAHYAAETRSVVSPHRTDLTFRKNIDTLLPFILHNLNSNKNLSLNSTKLLLSA
eukprot:150889_1